MCRSGFYFWEVTDRTERDVLMLEGEFLQEIDLSKCVTYLHFLADVRHYLTVQMNKTFNFPAQPGVRAEPDGAALPFKRHSTWHRAQG